MNSYTGITRIGLRRTVTRPALTLNVIVSGPTYCCADAVNTFPRASRPDRNVSRFRSRRPAGMRTEPSALCVDADNQPLFTMLPLRNGWPSGLCAIHQSSRTIAAAFSKLVIQLEIPADIDHSLPMLFCIGNAFVIASSILVFLLAGRLAELWPAQLHWQKLSGCADTRHPAY